VSLLPVVPRKAVRKAGHERRRCQGMAWRLHVENVNERIAPPPRPSRQRFIEVPYDGFGHGSVTSAEKPRAAEPLPSRGLGRGGRIRTSNRGCIRAVSYTHLTLPTKR